eukprot:2335137-Rhodomonas_salina.1
MLCDPREGGKRERASMRHDVRKRGGKKEEGGEGLGPAASSDRSCRAVRTLQRESESERERE